MANVRQTVINLNVGLFWIYTYGGLEACVFNWRERIERNMS